MICLLERIGNCISIDPLNKNKMKLYYTDYLSKSNSCCKKCTNEIYNLIQFDLQINENFNLPSNNEHDKYNTCMFGGFGHHHHHDGPSILVNSIFTNVIKWGGGLMCLHCRVKIRDIMLTTLGIR